MYERFTREARQCMVLAQEEVRALGHDLAGSEHLLLALCRVDAWVSDLLAGMGVTHQRLVKELDAGPEARAARVGGLNDPVVLGPDFKRAVAAAGLEADSFGASGVGAEHLLLGVLDVGGTAAACLHELGHSVDELRAAVLSVGTGPVDDDQDARFDVPATIEHPTASTARPLVAERPIDPPAADPAGVVARCPACKGPLADRVRHLRVPVDLEVTVDLVYCGICGHTLATRVVERG